MKNGNAVRIHGFLAILLICTYSALGQSTYTVEVDIPEYDSLNSEHYLISQQEDWARINDDTIRFFLLSPMKIMEKNISWLTARRRRRSIFHFLRSTLVGGRQDVELRQ